MIKTSSLIEECAKRNLAVTPQRLYRWAKDGLLPKPNPHRASQGYKGGLDENLWDETCLKSIVVIMGTSNQRISKRTVQHLIADGCWVSGDLLRTHLESSLDEWVDETQEVQPPQFSDDVIDNNVAIKGFGLFYSQLEGVIHAIKYALFTPEPWIGHPIIKAWGSQRISEGDDNMNMDNDGDNIPELHWLVDLVSLFSIGSIERLLKDMSDNDLETIFNKSNKLAPILVSAFNACDGSVLPDSLPLHMHFMIDTGKLPDKPTVRTVDDQTKIAYLAQITALLMYMVWEKKRDAVREKLPKVIFGLMSKYFPKELKKLIAEFKKTPDMFMSAFEAALTK